MGGVRPNPAAPPENNETANSNQPLAGGANINIVFSQIDEVLFADPPSESAMRVVAPCVPISPKAERGAKDKLPGTDCDDRIIEKVGAR